MAVGMSLPRHMPKSGMYHDCICSNQARPSASRISLAAVAPLRRQVQRVPNSLVGCYRTRKILLAVGVEDPSDVVQHALTTFRRGDLAPLAPYLPDAYRPASVDVVGTPGNDDATARVVAAGENATPGIQDFLPLMVAGQVLAERGPLAPLAGLLDVGARRVLPGHLLRRSRVLSTLRLGDSFQQRTAVTACTGEEAVLEWRLRQRDADELAESGAGSSSSGGGGSPSGWVLESLWRDASADEPLPTTPHPRRSPESVIRAQLAALQRCDVFEASEFCCWRRANKNKGFGFMVQADMLHRLLNHPAYMPLLGHSEATLGPAALLSGMEQVQEVRVVSPAGVGIYRWQLRLVSNGCWLCTAIQETSGA